MPAIEFHFLDAGGELQKLRLWLRERLKDAYSRAEGKLPLRPLDVVVRAGQSVIPEKGHVGFAPDARTIFLTVDPANPALITNCDASLERMFVHELHHAARWAGPELGATLGEALVSEGLAGHFAQEIYGGPAEPWECVPLEDIRDFAALAMRDWNTTDYGHGAWFFGSGQFPRWLGYSLGFQLVERFLSANPDETASSLVHSDAKPFRRFMQTV